MNSKITYRIITYLIIISFLSENIVYARGNLEGRSCLAQDSKAVLIRTTPEFTAEYQRQSGDEQYGRQLFSARVRKTAVNAPNVTFGDAPMDLIPHPSLPGEVVSHVLGSTNSGRANRQPKGFILVETMIILFVVACLASALLYLFVFAPDLVQLSFAGFIELLPSLGSLLAGSVLGAWILKQIKYGRDLLKNEPNYDLLSRVVAPTKESISKPIKFAEYKYKAITGISVEKIATGIKLSPEERNMLSELSSVGGSAVRYMLYGYSGNANRFAGVVTVLRKKYGVLSVKVKWMKHEGRRQLSEDFVVTELANKNPKGIIFHTSDIDPEIMDRVLPNHTIAEKKESTRRFKEKVFKKLGINDKGEYTFFALDRQDFQAGKRLYFGSFKFSSIWKMAEIEEWIYHIASGLFFALVFSSIFAHAEAMKVLASYEFFEEYINLILTVVVAPLAASSIAKVIRLRWDPVRSRHGAGKGGNIWLSIIQSMRMGWKMVGTFKYFAYARIFLSVLNIVLIPAIGVVIFGIGSAYIYLGMLFVKLIVERIINEYEHHYYTEVAEVAILFNEAAKREGYAENFHNISSFGDVFKELIYASGLLIGYGISASGMLAVFTVPLAILAALLICISSFLVTVRGRDYKNYLKIWGSGFTDLGPGKMLLAEGVTITTHPSNPLVVNARPAPVTPRFHILPWVEQLGAVIECAPGHRPTIIEIKKPSLLLGRIRGEKRIYVFKWTDEWIKVELISKDNPFEAKAVSIEDKPDGGCIIRFYPKNDGEDQGSAISGINIDEENDEEVDDAVQRPEDLYDWVLQTREKGFIYDKSIVNKLKECLASSNDEIKELAARAIIEEVLDLTDEGIDLRLKALEILKTFLEIDETSPVRDQIDIHTHTCISDGYQTPTALVVDAYENGLTAIAVTDHEVFASREAVKAAEILGIKLMAGVEASARFEGREVHMLILGDRKKLSDLSEEGKRILNKLKNMQDEWKERALTMRNRLKADFDISDEELFAASRGHIVPATLFMVIWNKYEDKVRQMAPGCKSWKEFFVGYIKNQKDIYVKVNEENALTIAEAIRLGQELKGCVVLAHPNELDKNNEKAISYMKKIIAQARLVDAKKKDGSHVFVGVEAYSHKARRHKISDNIIEAVRELNRTDYLSDPLVLFAGSDYHGKYSLPDDPLANEDGYPEDDSLITRSLGLEQNVSCGTICQSGHEGSYEALDEQLKRQFTALMAVHGPRTIDDGLLSEDEADLALVEYAKRFGIKINVKQLQDYRDVIKRYLKEYVIGKVSTGSSLKSLVTALGKLQRDVNLPNVYFSIPEDGGELFWVNEDYAGGHFNKEGTRIHISLPLILNRGLKAGVDVAKHEMAHIAGKGHQNDKGMKTVKRIASEILWKAKGNEGALPGNINARDTELVNIGLKKGSEWIWENVFPVFAQATPEAKAILEKRISHPCSTQAGIEKLRQPIYSVLELAKNEEGINIDMLQKILNDIKRYKELEKDYYEKLRDLRHMHYPHKYFGDYSKNHKTSYPETTKPIIALAQLIIALYRFEELLPDSDNPVIRLWKAKIRRTLTRPEVVRFFKYSTFLKYVMQYDNPFVFLSDKEFERAQPRLMGSLRETDRAEISYAVSIRQELREEGILEKLQGEFIALESELSDLWKLHAPITEGFKKGSKGDKHAFLRQFPAGIMKAPLADIEYNVRIAMLVAKYGYKFADMDSNKGSISLEEFYNPLLQEAESDIESRPRGVFDDLLSLFGGLSADLDDEGGLDEMEDFEPEKEVKVTNDKIVPININLAGQNGLLLSGPNMGGKTTTARAIGIAILLNQAGFPLPVKNAELAVFKNIYTVFPRPEQLQAGYGYFGALVKEVCDLIKKTGPGDLVILDEVPIGTDYKELVAVAIVLIEDLIKTGATVIVTGHLKKAFELIAERTGQTPFMHTVKMEGENVTPDYKLVPGIAKHSYAIELMKKAGFPDEVVELARKYYKAITEGSENIEDLAVNREQEESEEGQYTAIPYHYEMVQGIVAKLYPEDNFAFRSTQEKVMKVFRGSELYDNVKPTPIVDVVDVMEKGQSPGSMEEIAQLLNSDVLTPEQRLAITAIFMEQGMPYLDKLTQILAAFKLKAEREFRLYRYEKYDPEKIRAQIQALRKCIKDLTEYIIPLKACSNVANGIENMENILPKLDEMEEKYCKPLKEDMPRQEVEEHFNKWAAQMDTINMYLKPILFTIDAYCGIAKGNIKHRLIQPSFTAKQNSFSVKNSKPFFNSWYDSRNPFLKDGKPQDFSINPDKPVFVVTGPNSSGKTVLMMNAFINAALAWRGFYVSGDLEMSHFDNVFAFFGGQNEITSGESYFMNILGKYAKMLNEVTPNSLVVLDEMHGTDYFELAAIQLAVLQYLRKINATVIFNTHIRDGLKLVANKLGLDLWKTDVDYNETANEVKAHYTVSPDPNLEAKSYGLVIASQIMSDDQTLRAKEILEQLNQSTTRKWQTTSVMDYDPAKPWRFIVKMWRIHRLVQDSHNGYAKAYDCSAVSNEHTAHFGLSNVSLGLIFEVNDENIELALPGLSHVYEDKSSSDMDELKDRFAGQSCADLEELLAKSTPNSCNHMTVRNDDGLKITGGCLFYKDNSTKSEMHRSLSENKYTIGHMAKKGLPIVLLPEENNTLERFNEFRGIFSDYFRDNVLEYHDFTANVYRYEYEEIKPGIFMPKLIASIKTTEETASNINENDIDVLNEQHRSQFEELRAMLRENVIASGSEAISDKIATLPTAPRNDDSGDLSEDEADNALVEYAEKLNVCHTNLHRLQGYRKDIHEAFEELKNIKIYFLIPEVGKRLFWVKDSKTGEWRYTGAYFNKDGSALYVSLPIMENLHHVEAMKCITKVISYLTERPVIIQGQDNSNANLIGDDEKATMCLWVLLRYFAKGHKFSFNNFMARFKNYYSDNTMLDNVSEEDILKALSVLIEKGLVEKEGDLYRYLFTGWIDVVLNYFAESADRQRFSVDQFMEILDEVFAFKTGFLDKQHLFSKKYTKALIDKLRKNYFLTIMQSGRGIETLYSVSTTYKYQCQRIGNHLKHEEGVDTKISNGGFLDKETESVFQKVLPYITENGGKLIREGSFKVTKYKDYYNALAGFGGKIFLQVNPREFNNTIIVGYEAWDAIKDIPEALAELINSYAEWLYNGPKSGNHIDEIRFIRGLETPLLDEIINTIVERGTISALRLVAAISKMGGKQTMKQKRKIEIMEVKRLKTSVKRFKQKYLKGNKFQEERQIADKIIFEKNGILETCRLLDDLLYSLIKKMQCDKNGTALECLKTINMFVELDVIILRASQIVMIKLGSSAKAYTNSYGVMSELLHAASRRYIIVNNFLSVLPKNSLSSFAAEANYNLFQLAKDNVENYPKKEGGHNREIFETKRYRKGDDKIEGYAEAVKLLGLVDLGMFGKFIQRVEKDIDPYDLLDRKKPTIALATGISHNEISLLATARKLYPDINWIIIPEGTLEVLKGENPSKNHVSYMLLYDESGSLTYAEIKDLPSVDSIMVFSDVLLKDKKYIPEAPIERDMAVVNSAPVEVVTNSKIKTYSLLQGKPYLPRTILLPPRGVGLDVDVIDRFIKSAGNKAVLKSDCGARAEAVHMVGSAEEVVGKAKMYTEQGSLLQERIIAPKVYSYGKYRDWIARAFVELTPDNEVIVTGLICICYRNGEILVEQGHMLIEDALAKLKGIELSDDERDRIIQQLKDVSIGAFKTLDSYISEKYPRDQYPCKSVIGARPSFISVDLILDSKDMSPKLLEINGINSGRISALQDIASPDTFEVGRGFLGILAENARRQFAEAEKYDNKDVYDKAVNEYIEIIEATSKDNNTPIILALDIDIGNMGGRLKIEELLKQIQEVSSLLGNVYFVAGHGADLPGLVQKKAEAIKERMKIADAGIKSVVITKQKEIVLETANVSILKVDDSELGLMSEYVPIVELLNFALLLFAADDTNSEKHKVFELLTGTKLTEEMLALIKKGQISIPLVKPQKVPPDTYEQQVQVLRSA